MTDALRDVVRHGTAVGSVGARINFPAGGKTGTTNDGFDVWFIGFTPDMVTGIWIGFDQPKRIKSNAQGGVLAAPAWTAMMREVYERRTPPAAWPRPDGLTALDIDKTTGYKATPFCPKDVHYIESFIPGTEPTAFCPIHSPFGSVGGVMGGSPGAASGSHRSATAPAAPTAQQTAPGPAERRRCRVRHRGHGRRRPARHRTAVGCGRAGWRLGGCCRWRPGDRAWGGPHLGARAGSSRSAPTPPSRGRLMRWHEEFADGILLPGLVNAHTHLELTGLDGSRPEPDFAAWIRRVRELKTERSADEFLEAARAGSGGSATRQG